MADEAVDIAAFNAEVDAGLAVVRVKPLGAGGGGVEASADQGSALTVTESGTLHVLGRQREYTYPRYVIPPNEEQEHLYQQFMPVRVEAFLQGVNVNIVCYGHTGSGKTHTMFGPPGLMARAASGEFGTECYVDYGLCPRGLLDIIGRVEQMRTNQPHMIFELNASAVEMTFMEGNLDMFLKEQEACVKKGLYATSACGVNLDKTVKPPILFGQTEHRITRPEDAFELFRAISARNTTCTGQNDSSSRSHCFVILTLYACEPTSGTVRVSRLQFADLAGSERLAEAHNGCTNIYDKATQGMWEGLMCNWSLMMLSQRVRELVAAGQAGKSQKALVQQSFKTQSEPDLIPLLSGTLAGSALSLIIVCLSSAKANITHNVNALEFGETFAKLKVRPSLEQPTSLAALRKRAEHLQASGKAAGGVNPKYVITRKAQARSGESLMGLVERLSKAA